MRFITRLKKLPAEFAEQWCWSLAGISVQMCALEAVSKKTIPPGPGYLHFLCLQVTVWKDYRVHILSNMKLITPWKHQL